MNGHQHTWDATLTAVDSLISGKKRSDGKNWSHAFDMMDVFLEVWIYGHRDIRCLAVQVPNQACAQRAQLKDRLKDLSVVHVAGTKGKVSHSVAATELTLLHAQRLLDAMHSPCACSGVHLRHGGEHAASLWLQDWALHLATPV